jgi:hypothetical protein
MVPLPGFKSARPKTSFSPLDIRLALFANGYHPVLARGKISDVTGWRTPVSSPEEIASLTSSNPGYPNTGLLCGDLVGIDIDALDPETAAALLAMALALPGADRALQRVGKSPKVTLLFRATVVSKKLATKPYRVNEWKCQVEVMADGQQIIGFGIHPDTQAQYEWIGPSPLDVRFADLPEITPETIEGFVAEAEAYLAAHGELIATARPSKPQQEYKPTEQRAAAGDGIWAELKARAMANLGAWVPALGLSGTKAYEQGYLARADFRPSTSSTGKTGAKRGLSMCFSPVGIVDYADGNRGYNPIDIASEVLGVSPSEAADWLRAHVGDERPPHDPSWADGLIANAATKKQEKYQAANDNVPDEDEDDEQEQSSMPSVSSGGLPEHLCFPPGAVGDFARFIVDCARFPSPHLSLVASLAFTAGLIGRRYRGPTGLRSNLYIVGLAESGFGKDITIRASAALADSTEYGPKVSELLFADQIRSLPGLAGKLRKSPSAIVIQDEFGRWLAEHTGRNVASHRAEITASIMELTGAPTGFWGGMEKAGGNIARIVQPCLTIHGVSTPSTFWNALSNGNISEGLLGRLVLIDVGHADPVKVRRPAGSIEDIPEELSDQVAALLGLSSGKYTGPFFALNAKSDEKPYPMMTADWGDGVDDLFEAFDDRIRAMKKSIDPQYRPILNRVGENAARLALIVAVGCDPKEPIITTEIQQWANAVAEHSLRVILNGADMNIADNDKALEYLKVKQIVARKRAGGITMKGLVKAVRGSLDTRRLDDIIRMLRVSHEVHYAKVVSESGQTKLRFWTASDLPSGAVILSVG